MFMCRLYLRNLIELLANLNSNRRPCCIKQSAIDLRQGCVLTIDCLRTTYRAGTRNRFWIWITSGCMSISLLLLVTFAGIWWKCMFCIQIGARRLLERRVDYRADLFARNDSTIGTITATPLVTRLWKKYSLKSKPSSKTQYSRASCTERKTWPTICCFQMASSKSESFSISSYFESIVWAFLRSEPRPDSK